MHDLIIDNIVIDFDDNDNSLFEYATIKKNRFIQLPVNIWVSVDIKTKHNTPRIKFQNNKSDRLTDINDLIPMSISDKPQILGSNLPKINLSSTDINKIKMFVKKNKDLLLQFWNQEIDEIDLYNSLDFNFSQINEHNFYNGKIKLSNYNYEANIQIFENPSSAEIKSMISVTDLRFLITMNDDLYVWDGKIAIHDDIISNFFGDIPIYLKGVFKENKVAISTYVSKYEKQIDSSSISDVVLDNLWNNCCNLFKSIYGENYSIIENNGFSE